jgi:putative transposase
MDAILTDKAEQLATEIATQAKTLDDLNGLIKLMMKSALERMLDTEMDVHLGRKRPPGLTTDSPPRVAGNSDAKVPAKKGPKNRRNGHSQKTVQGDLGEIKLTTPRDRWYLRATVGP